MAKAKQKTAQQMLRQKEQRNLRRRTKTAIRNLEKELNQNIEIDLNEFLQNRSRPLSAKQLSELRGEKLVNLVKREGSVVFDSGDIVPLKEYNQILKLVEKSQKMAKKYGSTRDIQPPTGVMSVTGLQKFKTFVERTAQSEYWELEREQMIANFLQSLSALGSNSIGYTKIVKRIKRIGKTRTINILSALVDSRRSYSVAYYFASNQEEMKSRLQDIFEAFGIEWDDNVNYMADVKASKSEQEGGFEEISDEEIEDIFG